MAQPAPASLAATRVQSRFANPIWNGSLGDYVRLTCRDRTQTTEIVSN